MSDIVKMTPEKLRELQLKQLDMLVYFKDFCVKNNLTFYLIGGCLIGALRNGGFVPWDDDVDVLMPRADYEKLVNRENERLRISLNSAKALSEQTGKPIIVFFHFPPVRGSFVCNKLVETLKEFGITRCFYGHIHGDYVTPQTSEHDGISFSLISADFLDFHPLPIIY